MARSPAKTRSFGTVRMMKKKPVTTATITEVMPTMRSKLAVMELTSIAAATDDGDVPGSTATPTRLSGTSGALGWAAATVRRKVPMVVYAVGAALNLDSSVWPTIFSRRPVGWRTMVAPPRKPLGLSAQSTRASPGPGRRPETILARPPGLPGC